MKISAVSRILILSLLLISLTVLCLYFSSEYKNNLEYNSYESILSSNYPVNQIVYVKGSISEINSDGYYIHDNYKGNDIILKVLGPSPGELNDELSIIGLLGPSYQILSVKKIRLISYWKYNFLLLRSLVASIFLMIIFINYWKLDFKKIVFKRR